MTTAQWLYVILLATYAILFLVFSRLFYWRHYAQKHYYDKRPTGLSEAMIAHMAYSAGREVPRFSIFIPARNEADVIEKTISHLSQLRYSPEHYELLAVTDEKELQAAAEERSQLQAALLPALSGAAPWKGGEKEEAVLTALLARLALEESPLAAELLPLSVHHRHEITRDIALALLPNPGKVNRERIAEAIRRCLPQASADEIARLSPAFLGLAMPAALAAAHLMQAETAPQDPTGIRIIRRIREATAEQLTSWLARAFTEALPTTQEIVERKQAEFADTPGLPTLKHVVVPWDFDGYVGGVCTGKFVPSTKGRALNYAFRFANPGSEVWAFYDAESRPDRDVLLYVAWRRLTVGDKFQIAQGPVYQIRNFWKTGPLCKIAGLYQAASHEWQIPYLLKSIPFIGGTNIFATRDLMLQIGGFDDTVLTEDMELGARAWLKGDAWPEFLPYASSEQTPPTFKAFFRQRLRWGSGYLQVYDKIKADKSLDETKKQKLLRTYWWKGHFSWTLFQLIALLPILVVLLRSYRLLDMSATPIYFTGVLAALGPIYFAFTLYCFFHYYRHMDVAPARKQMTGVAQLLALPFSAFFLPMPYSSALVLKWIGRAPKGWVKTPRTKE